MARRLRHDEPGAKYHVMNRGVARRTIFDTRADFRFFLACLGRAARRLEIEVLAYALMRTHFHLYLRSLGGLSVAMRRIQQRHARRFNRMHRRDGPLLRGRFLARRVRGGRHARNVVLYTHENPVVARVCTRPEDYKWSSARLLVGRRVPPWCNDEEIRRYGLVGGRIPTADDNALQARAELVEARLRAPLEAEEDQLDASSPESVVSWMRRKARLADGSVSGLPEVGARTLSRVLRQEFAGAAQTPTPVPGAGTYPTLDLLLAGLLRDVACCAHAGIAAIMHVDVSRARRLGRFHRRCIEHMPLYAQLAAEVITRCTASLEERRDSSPGTNRSQL